MMEGWLYDLGPISLDAGLTLGRGQILDVVFPHGCQNWTYTGSDSTQMRQFRDFFAANLNVLKCDLKKTRICPIWANFTQFRANSDIAVFPAWIYEEILRA